MNPNDAVAQLLFSTIRSQHAEIALARDDRELATQLLDVSDPRHQPALQQLQAANQQAERQAQERLHLDKLVERTNSTWQVIREGGFAEENLEEWLHRNANTSFSDDGMRVVFEVNGMLEHTTRLASGA